MNRPAWYAKLNQRAARLKRESWALFLAWKDPETPRFARLIILVAIAYAASPVDLIPDFIPVLGQLDDLVILPALIGWAIRLIPAAVLARSRTAAEKHLSSGDRVRTPAAIIAGILFVLVWIALSVWLVTRFI
jgi:uncharacterized membrane protein YkvA (DUF1232 family)